MIPSCQENRNTSIHTYIHTCRIPTNTLQHVPTLSAGRKSSQCVAVESSNAAERSHDRLIAPPQLPNIAVNPCTCVHTRHTGTTGRGHRAPCTEHRVTRFGWMRRNRLSAEAIFIYTAEPRQLLQNLSKRKGGKREEDTERSVGRINRRRLTRRPIGRV